MRRRAAGRSRRGVGRGEAGAVCGGLDFLLAAYILYDAVGALTEREEPLNSPMGIVLSVLSLAIMRGSTGR